MGSGREDPDLIHLLITGFSAKQLLNCEVTCAQVIVITLTMGGLALFSSSCHVLGTDQELLHEGDPI